MIAKTRLTLFRVKNIAMMMHKSDMATAKLPDKMGLKILSFDTVQ